jgi:hypothetical protein
LYYPILAIWANGGWKVTARIRYHGSRLTVDTSLVTELLRIIGKVIFTGRNIVYSLGRDGHRTILSESIRKQTEGFEKSG